jgi:hypothetical protein
MPSRAPPEIHTNVRHDNEIAFMIRYCLKPYDRRSAIPTTRKNRSQSGNFVDIMLAAPIMPIVRRTPSSKHMRL